MFFIVPQYYGKPVKVVGHLALPRQQAQTPHRDPFDRLLLAQASADGLLLITADRQLRAYPGPIRLMDARK